MSKKDLLDKALKVSGFDTPEAPKPTTKVEAYIKRIITETDMSKEEIEEMVQEKKDELNGLISTEGALFVIGKEMGIDARTPKEIREEKIAQESYNNSLTVGFGTSKTPKQAIIAKQKANTPEPFKTETEAFFDQPTDVQIPPNKETTYTFKFIDKEVKRPQPKIEKIEPPEKFSLATIDTEKTKLPSMEEVDAHLAMYRYVKEQIIDESDKMFLSGKAFVKKSGWRKFVHPFNLSIAIVSQRVFEMGTAQDDKPDIHAEFIVKVSRPTGFCRNCGEPIYQSIESYALKSKSEYWSEKYKNFGSFNLHNLVVTARTRAVNIGISDLVGQGEVSAEEMQHNEDISFGGT